MKRNTHLLLLIFVAVTACGCGSKYDLVPVKGRVTINGEPVAGAIITQPIGKDTVNPGPGSGAVLDENGEFELALQIDENQKGAVPGEHRIRVNEARDSKPSDDDSMVRGVKLSVPPEYRDGSVTYTIPPEGTDQMLIEIETKKRR